MANFKDWILTEEAYFGYVLADLGAGLCNLLEIRKRGKTTSPQKTLWNLAPNIEKMPPPEDRRPAGKVHVPKFDPDIAAKMAPFDDPEIAKSCPITPLSGYAKHIQYIKAFAMKSPENFAQVMMFSPLSANVPFPKHWDNFNALMLLLHHVHPHKVTEQELKDLMSSFDDKYHSLGHTINGFKLRTIAEIWSAKDQLFKELPALAGRAGDRELIARLCQFTGVQPVKAGFMAQLLFGRAGCIDTHNIDIYSHVFPDMAAELGYTGTDEKGYEKDNSKWNVNRAQLMKGKIPKGIDDYVGTLNKLQGRGIGTEQMWDIWVDFVENFYRYISEHGMGAYTPMGAALDPNNPVYKNLNGLWIPKTLPAGRTGGEGEEGRQIKIPLIGGRGAGGSATHLQLSPEEMFRQRNAMYRFGKPGGAAAASIPFATLEKPDGTKEPLEKSIGMGMEPTDVHYFGRPGEEELDPDYVRYVAKKRVSTGGRRGAEAEEEKDRLRKIQARVPALPGFDDDTPLPTKLSKKKKKH